MPSINHATKEITPKIVYYGPALGGKTTNLQFMHENLPACARSRLVSLATQSDRTIFFDLLPIGLGHIRGFKIRVQLFTVPGQVAYNATRRLVLQGADGIVFVADSQSAMLEANVESLDNLEENLESYNVKLADVPLVLQFNKRDLPRLSDVAELNRKLNRYDAPTVESVATEGEGVRHTFKAISELVLYSMIRKYNLDVKLVI